MLRRLLWLGMFRRLVWMALLGGVRRSRFGRVRMMMWHGQMCNRGSGGGSRYSQCDANNQQLPDQVLVSPNKYCSAESPWVFSAVSPFCLVPVPPIARGESPRNDNHSAGR
jgi:hypothetical protein